MNAALAIAVFLLLLLLLVATPPKRQEVGRLDRLDELILEEIEPKVQRLSRAGKAELKKRLDN